MNDFSFSELTFMYADAPRISKKKTTEFASDDDLADWLGAEQL